MWSVFKQEVNAFFSSLIGYLVIGVFLLFLGLMIWVFPENSLLDFQYATLDPLFRLAPAVFIFLVPAITMRSFAEEQQTGTFELLATRPVTDMDIISGKFLAALVLLGFALVPTAIYYYSVYQLGSPPGNIDSGAILGSYLGLFMMGGAFAAIGLFASSLSKNQILAFVLGSFLCFLLFWAFYYVSKFPSFVGTIDDIIQKFGIDYHYASISRGVIDTRDVLYFLSIIAIFLIATEWVLKKNRV